jgi:flagellar biogenesis protein FliO
MELLSQSAAIAGVLVLLAATVWALQRRGLASFSVRGGSPRRMQVIERLPLTAQHALHLVRIEGRTLIVASAPGGCTVIGSANDVQELPK